MTNEQLIESLCSAPDAQARRALLDANPSSLHISTVVALKERADQMEHDDARQALAIGRIAEEVADLMASDEARALAFWSQANAHDFLSENESAVRCYERAAELFKSAGKPLEAARTAIGHMFTLMQLGQLDASQRLAEEARTLFVEHQDVMSLAKIDMNLGNLHYQQGKYSQALSDYKQATHAFYLLGEDLYGAMNQINQASALTMLDDFLEAEHLHQLARPIFEEADLRTAVASVDHDLAFLQYARGNYSEAFRTFERARTTFASLDLQVNLAMTDLVESDLYLELNLPDEALRLAQQAEKAFAEMGMTYESARSQTNHAVALARLGQRENADQAFVDAQKLFASIENEAWIAHIDLQRAEVLSQITHQREMARILAARASAAYQKLGMKTKQAYAHIVSAHCWASENQWEACRQSLFAARDVLGNLAAPWLSQRIDTGLGRVSEGLQEPDQAIDYYQKAAFTIEQIAATLSADEQRTAFVADKLTPYEALVTLYAAHSPENSFSWAERAKSRALVDLLASGVRPKLHIDNEMDANRVERLQMLRDELNWLYTRLTRGAAPGETGAPAAAPDTWEKIEEREKEATSIWRALQSRHAEDLSLIRTAPIALADIQAQLPQDTVLVEYFVAREQLTIFVIKNDRMDIFSSVVALADVLPLTESLAFQFSKFQYGMAYYQRHKVTMLHNTQDVLAQLGEKLLAPVWAAIADAKALIIIPHGPLHALPFHSLRVHGKYLIETHAISYAPSASVLKFCWEKTVLPPSKPLFVAVPDERISHVSEEIQNLSALFPDAEVLFGEDATVARLSKAAQDCGLLHLAAHGLFRPEAPLLSSIRLADQWLAVQDIYNLELKASLVTLSACETGLGQDAGGDDMVGLVRGFLYAGAASLVVSLWTVDDESMTRLVTKFYSSWLTGLSKANALRDAQLALLEIYEHPYFWSPLILVGNEK